MSVRGESNQVGAAESQSKAGRNAGYEVLIVEDDRAVAEALADLLKYYGVSVAIAGSLFDASRELHKNSPACVLIDLGLPDGSGIQIVRRLRSSGAMTRIGVMTNATAPEVLARVHTARPDEIFAKPLVVLDVVKWARQSVAAHADAQQAA